MDAVNDNIAAAISKNKTWLFVPATRIDRVAKAFASDADAVIVDLEDAVAQEDKAQAREALKKYYDDQNDTQNHQPIWLRINQAGSQAFPKDIALCQQMPKIAGVLLAKAEKAADIEYVHQRTGLPVIALIESAAGLYHIDSMAKTTGLIAFSYGFLDLCNDLRVQAGTPSADIIANQIRYQLILTSKIHQLAPPIDTIYPDFNDGAGLRARVQLWSQMGMLGMLCIHPKQVATVQQALQPTASELEFAQRVVAEYEQSGQAVFKIEGEMVDAPVIERCRQLLAKWQAVK
ncbi:MAG: CoA ester lyase [Psychrobacter sp.]|jgi:citrate lyase subunit beta/citryl-CoA lyase/(S)-citramalyl-CoA lyase|uniref:HpcH/HpaI aldolase/citrate lyase family protein n=1 Tax=Psychrobacter namhaensis TaxID=292734 RepID=A0ABW8L4X2_9GAMM|nr:MULTISPECIES: CoA ester lyase [Psychrobacter]MCD6251116.1 CoA ester lyase [Psychrobacter sp.]HCN16913.1 CoA ester lyase [Psychrobacter sp.]